MMTDAAPFHADLVPEAPEGGRAVWLRTADGVRLRAVIWPREGARGTVFILQGRSEYIEKYAPLAAELARAGLASVSLDWRGQGLSDRLSVRPMMGHVDRFADYQTDLGALLSTAEAEGLPRPFHLFSHSMGGAIALRALHGGFPAAQSVFSAPMWGIHFAPALVPVAWSVAVAAPPLRAGQRYVPTTGPKTYVAHAPFEGNTLTSDPAQYGLMRDQVLARPELGLGGPSITWLREALFECRALVRRPPPSARALTGLGGREQVVDPRPVRSVMGRWSGGELKVLPEARHELLMEREDLRRDFLQAALDRLAG